jgi:hypothetical protein
VITKADLKIWIIDALRDLGGQGRIWEMSKHIWDHHDKELKAAGPLFYTWQYDMRWAGQKLQKEGKLSKAGKNYTWYLTP